MWLDRTDPVPIRFAAEHVGRGPSVDGESGRPGAFDDLGARNNAFTSSEMTCFYATMLPEKLSPCLSLLARMMRPALRQADFDTEKGVILEEIAMYKDNPFWVLYEASIEKHFGAHPLAHRVLGTEATITALQRAFLDVRREERREQAVHAREDTQKAPGKEIGADYMMRGSIATILDEQDGAKAVFYQIDLEMVDMENNVKAWFGQKKIKKVVEKKRTIF